MIQENEIRIGNWFKHDGVWSYRNERADTTFNFQWERMDWYALGECTLSLEYIKPIPLSIEILEKSGFSYIHDRGHWSDSPERGVYNKNDFQISEHDGIFYLGIDSNSNPFYSFRGIVLGFVHQLQNVYYYLRGSELDVVCSPDCRTRC